MRRQARGFSLVEIMVALTILAVTLAGFAGLTFQYLRRTQTMNGRVAEMAIVAEQSQRLTVLPFDSLSGRAGCTTVSTGPLAHTRCITVTDVSGTRKRVQITIAPANTAIKPDTVWFHRMKPASNPFCTTC
jgi:prepilin-type N-terminal cleavage/methylation domain-containing protein